MHSLHDYFMLALRRHGLPLPRCGWSPLRGCAVQYAWPERALVLEFSEGMGLPPAAGSAWDEALMEAGYTVFRFTPRWLRSGDVIAVLQQRLAPTQAAEKQEAA